jgi:O-antigen/teichoic acid export membrane protein
MLRFGLPTVPADASVYALQVADRFYLYHGDSPHAAGVYATGVQLATVVFVAVRGFQYAWPPLAYSIETDEEASRLYALVTTYFVLATGVVVCAVGLLARWYVRFLSAPQYHQAYLAVPWLSLGWALYGLYLVLVVVAGRAGVTSRNLPAAASGLAVNIVLLFTLVPRGGANLGITGAGIALCAAYLVMLAVMYMLTRRLFEVHFQWRRMAHLVAIFAGVALSGEFLLPSHGFSGLALRAAWFCLAPLLLWVTRFVTPGERAHAGELLAEARRRAVAWRARGGEIEAYAEDPLRDV